KGIATAINQALAVWGMNCGAKRAYLQVFAENKPALALYRHLGFKEIYQYWYRWLPPNGENGKFGCRGVYYQLV
ncbi:MAG: GNAT family N-acetyltransferase, partial [Candidatus Thorarchaeota archaeon]